MKRSSGTPVLDPENPHSAVYLAADAASGISGQILSVRNNEIFLFNQPRPIRSLHRSDGWIRRTCG